MKAQILNLDPDNYQRHLIHSEGRTWQETNCYVDVWIELLHSLGYEPIAALPFTIANDFEGDQWTFFKYPLEDLYNLYGLDVQELAIWQPLTQHIYEQVSRGRPVLVELDSFYLPDTHGTAYGIDHVKSTAAVMSIDIENRQLGYFHNQGYYHLKGENFQKIFHLQSEPDPSILPPYVEFVKQRDMDYGSQKLLDRSLQSLSKQVLLLPEKNPFVAFKQRFAEDVQWLMEDSIETFHIYSFATLRQFGACFELAATYFEWLQRQSVGDTEPLIESYRTITEMAKATQFQLARTIARRKPLALDNIDNMGEAWEKAAAHLKGHFG